MSQISVVVIDGQRTFGDALAGRLSAEAGLRVVAAVESVASASRLLVGRHVDIALLDAELAEGMRFATEVTRPRVAAQHPVRVIMLGTLPEAGRIVEALRAGISGWVRKEDAI